MLLLILFVGIVALFVAFSLRFADAATPKVPALRKDGTPRKAPVRKSAIERMRAEAEAREARERGIKRKFVKELFANVPGLSAVADIAETLAKNAREVALYADPAHCAELVSRLTARIARAEARHKVALAAQGSESAGVTMALDTLAQVGEALYQSALAENGPPDWDAIAAKYLPADTVAFLLSQGQTDVFAAFRRSKSEDTPEGSPEDSDIPADTLGADDADADDAPDADDAS